MPNGKYDFEYDEPVSIPLDPETTLQAMLDTSAAQSDSSASEEDEEDD